MALPQTENVQIICKENNFLLATSLHAYQSSPPIPQPAPYNKLHLLALYYATALPSHFWTPYQNKMLALYSCAYTKTLQLFLSFCNFKLLPRPHAILCNFPFNYVPLYMLCLINTLSSSMEFHSLPSSLHSFIQAHPEFSVPSSTTHSDSTQTSRFSLSCIRKLLHTSNVKDLSCLSHWREGWLQTPTHQVQKPIIKQVIVLIILIKLIWFLFGQSSIN